MDTQEIRFALRTGEDIHYDWDMGYYFLSSGRHNRVTSDQIIELERANEIAPTRTGYGYTHISRIPFEQRLARAENQLIRDIAEARHEIANMGSSWWDVQKYNRHSAFIRLAVVCINARNFRDPYGIGQLEVDEFFIRLDARHLDRRIREWQ
jgi:hypothetical protein